uniref:DDHD domain-containing protein n=1 Tax=Globisporangium ultimum (strain ATCC 200006 / CBS 805.95 / DAOM BR144) TaxID=431595 RepID=K3X310_GLOUD
MYHVAEIVRDAKRDMQERYEGHSTWAAYTPFPFLYALSVQITQTMQRKAPDLVKRAAVCTRDHVADVITTSQRNVVEFRLTTTRTGQRVFYQIKNQVETVPLPGAIEPVRRHGAVPVFNAVEGFAQFVTSEELPELYFVAKNSMGGNVFLRHLVLPPLGAMERVVRYVVIFPSQIVFPSREEIETRTDLFLDVSTTRVQSVVEYIYSATEVLDQHWSMVQWNILGRGPYESLSSERRTEVIKSIFQRMLIIESKFKMYEFMASIKMQNEMLYSDLLKEYPHFGGIPLNEEEIASNEALLRELDYHNQNSFPCWFYKKLEATSSSDSEAQGAEENSDSNNGHGHNSKWIEFPPHENRRLERKYRWYQRQKELKRYPLPSSIVLVDEGRHEVCMETMEMKPVYWPALEKQVVCRSLWLYAQRNYGLAPYNPMAAVVLEDSFTYYLSHYDEEKRRIQAIEEQQRTFFYSPSPATYAHKWSMSVPVEGHLVEFKGPQDIMQYKRLLAGTTPFTSKRRVYRGDPRIKSDAKNLELWKRAMLCDDEGRPIQSEDDSAPRVDDDEDIDEEIDHLVLIVHGIGDALKTIDIINVVTLRSITDCATNLRDLHKEALRSSHFDHLASNERPRTEFLPIEWHSKLHMEGLDRMISDVTLPAIPKLRDFANDTILDVLFFMSPMFHQVILNEVAKEMNRVFTLFQSRNIGWSNGEMKQKRKKVSIIAHSLGAIICFDVLNHQNIYTQTPHRKRDAESSSTDNEDEDFTDNEDDSESTNGFEAMLVDRLHQRSQGESECNATSGRLNGTWKPENGVARSLFRRRREGKRAPQTRQQHPVAVPKLAFEVEDLFCFGSPVGLFLNVRGQKIDRDFRLPTCHRLFNIYHPYDPVAYRIEPIINPRRANSKAVIIRTFEGKLRFQYQLKNSFRVMWQTLRRWRRDFEYQVENSVRAIGLVESTPSVLAEGSNSNGLSIDTCSDGGQHEMLDPRRRNSPQVVRDREEGAVDRDLFGSLCQGYPIDYTLQENEIEIANEYLFALTAHVIYWSNRDASLFVAQKMILEPPMDEAPPAPVGASRLEAELVVDDPESQTSSLSSSSASSSTDSASPPAGTRRRRQRRL